MNARVFRLAALAVTLLIPAAGQVAILQIRFVDGEGAVRPPGRKVAHPLTVEVADETGRPVAGASVTFHLPEEGAGGVFANGLHTEIATTDAQGRAAMPAMRVGRAAGGFSIRVVALKEQARAGAVASQFADEAAAATAGRGRGRWLAVAAVVGGGMAAGVVSAVRRAPGTSSAGPASPPAPPAAPVAVTIGSPTTTVGRP